MRVFVELVLLSRLRQDDADVELIEEVPKEPKPEELELPAVL